MRNFKIKIKLDEGNEISYKTTTSVDMTVEEMNLIADLADKYTFGEFRTTHEQNIALVDVPQKDLFDLFIKEKMQSNV